MRATLYTVPAYAAFQVGISTNPDILIGKEHWLFESIKRDFDEYRGVVKPDPAAIERWKHLYLERMAFVGRAGADFLFVIAPLKQSVNSEYLPKTWRKIGDETRIKQFSEGMRDLNMDILDLTDALLARRKLGEQLWYKYDTHWNFVGALAATEAVVNRLRDRHPNIAPFDRNEYRIASNGNGLRFGISPLDLASRLGIAALREPDYTVEKIGGWTTTETVLHSSWMTIYSYTKNAPSLPTLVMYGDSFSFPMRRFMAEHFRRSVFVNPWEAQDWEKSQFPTSFIEAERPDIVINMRIEGGILGVAANPPEISESDDTSLH